MRAEASVEPPSGCRDAKQQANGEVDCAWVNPTPFWLNVRLRLVSWELSGGGQWVLIPHTQK